MKLFTLATKMTAFGLVGAALIGTSGAWAKTTTTKTQTPTKTQAKTSAPVKAQASTVDQTAKQNEQQATQASPEEAIESICDIAALGAMDLVAMRQSDKSLDAAKAHIAAMKNDLKYFGFNDALITTFDNYWHGTLDWVYSEAPLTNAYSKQVFMRGTYYVNYANCMQGAFGDAKAQ